MTCTGFIFFLNRTNRSGILGARPIGGLAQSGPWKLDVRFNRAVLAKRIRLLGRYRNRVTVLEEDGVAVIRRFVGPRAFVYADPPYLDKGSELYLNGLTWADHAKLSAVLGRSRSPWMVTYDVDERVRTLFPRHRRVEFSIAHTAQRQHIGDELAIFSDGLRVTSLDGLGRDPVFVLA